MGAERGVLIRNGEAIQAFKDLKVIVLDKTGTITKGEPSLTDVVSAQDGNDEELLRLAASVEAASEHPIAQAVVQAAKDRDIKIAEVNDFESLTARGVVGNVDGRAVKIGNRRLAEESGVDLGDLGARLEELEENGKTAFVVLVDGGVAGLIAVADTVKEDSRAAVEAIKKLGLEPVMVTGDNQRTAHHIAKEVGIEKVIAGVLPQGKIDAIKELEQECGPHVAMVGDGINDAPALKKANVGIAIGAGADVAIEAADVTIIAGSLTKVVESIRLSRATFRKIVQNLFWASFYNLAAIPVAAMGLLHPMIGVIAMTSSSVSVIGNSILLRRFNKHLDSIEE